MCTAICMESGNFYFGRNMDIEEEFGQRIVKCPRKFPLKFKFINTLSTHYAVMGTAAVIDGYPLFADAFNERGLCMAGLHFPATAYYFPEPQSGRLNLSPFELIPYLLGRCADITEARRELERMTLVDVPFSTDIPLTPLHWIVADKTGALAVEPTSDGLRIYDDTVGVLTNEPPFPYHLAELCRYSNLTNGHVTNGVFPDVTPISLGLGASGLHGDYSSPSRFVKAAYLCRVCKLPKNADEQARVTHLFRLLYAVAPPYGAVLTADGRPHYSLYSCCMNAQSTTYYVCNYNSMSISAKTMSVLDMNSSVLI